MAHAYRGSAWSAHLDRARGAIGRAEPAAGRAALEHSSVSARCLAAISCRCGRRASSNPEHTFGSATRAGFSRDPGKAIDSSGQAGRGTCCASGQTSGCARPAELTRSQRGKPARGMNAATSR